MSASSRFAWAFVLSCAVMLLLALLLPLADGRRIESVFAFLGGVAIILMVASAAGWAVSA